MKRLPLLPLLVLGILLSLAAATGALRRSPALVVNAEEKGIRVDLRYVDGYSNYGPSDVSGTAVLWPREGVARLSVHYVPHLLGGQSYVWWIVNTQTGASMRLGLFNTDDAGVASTDTFLTRSLPSGANSVLVTVAPRGVTPSTPGQRRTLSGSFSPDAIAAALTTPSMPTPPTTIGSSTTTGPATNPGNNDDPSGALKLPVSVVLLPQTGGAPRTALAPRHR